jgi:hypothetical protein
LVIDQLFVVRLLLRFGPFQNAPRGIFRAKTFLRVIGVTVLSGKALVRPKSNCASTPAQAKMGVRWH